MHNILLGVVRQFARYWFNQRRKEYSLSKEQIKEVDDYLKALKIHYQLGKLTRSITIKKDWKAREWENWLLYYSAPIPSKVLPDKYSKYWLKLVEALYILLQSEITETELEKSNVLLREFYFRNGIIVCDKCNDL